MEARITIAIADDHYELRKRICEILDQMGFYVMIEAENGNDLISQLEQAEDLPEICLLDYRMPHLKGDEVAGILSKKYPDMKIAAMTGDMTTDCMIKMLGNGCSSFLVKNSNPNEWKACIQELKAKGYFYSEWMKKHLLTFIKQNYAEIANIV